VELLFVRHGEPAWVRDGLSVDDPDLTDRGRAQAERLAARLADTEVHRLVVSPLRRARQTAEPVARALGLEPEILPWLAEIANPTWQGTPAEHVERIFAESRHRPVQEHWEGLPGGESFRDFHRRVTHGLEQFLETDGSQRTSNHPPLWQLRDPGHRVVVVAHAGTNASAIGYLLGIDPVPWEWERFVSFHASVSELRPIPISGQHSFSLFRFSDVVHLDDGLQSR
jgi:probable phosphoglycerate mutase